MLLHVGMGIGCIVEEEPLLIIQNEMDSIGIQTFKIYIYLLASPGEVNDANPLVKATGFLLKFLCNKDFFGARMTKIDTVRKL